VYLTCGMWRFENALMRSNHTCAQYACSIFDVLVRRTHAVTVDNRNFASESPEWILENMKIRASSNEKRNRDKFQIYLLPQERFLNDVSFFFSWILNVLFLQILQIKITSCAVCSCYWYVTFVLRSYYIVIISRRKTVVTVAGVIRVFRRRYHSTRYIKNNYNEPLGVRISVSLKNWPISFCTPTSTQVFVRVKLRIWDIPWQGKLPYFLPERK